MVYLNFTLISLVFILCSCTQDTGNTNLSVDLNSTVSLEMIWVEPGTFTMGQAGTREIENNVTITKGFYLGKYEITQAQYQAVMGSNYKKHANPSHFKDNLNRPVERVNIPAVVKFIELLNKKEDTNLPKGYQYGLPTDAEWEYACRAGTSTLFSWGDEISQNDANWRFGDEANETVDVGSYKPNPWGFYDMHGNVWEWTADWYSTLNSNPRTDPFISDGGGKMVVRGGAYSEPAKHCYSAIRGRHNPNQPFTNNGFRIALRQTSIVGE